MTKRRFNAWRMFRQWRRRWPKQFQSPWVRFAAWLDMQFVDHGFLRPFYNRPERIAEGVYRSNHPSPRLIRQLSRRGFATILSLRGRNASGAYLYEEEACAQSGIELHTLRFYSKKAPSKAKIRRFAGLLDALPKPILLHCKSGADRSGLAAALYLLISGQGTVAEAKRHLSLRYLHIRHARTGILDHFIEAYERFNTVTPTPFMEWVENHYDPKALAREFKPSGWANFLVDRILRRE